MKQTPCCRGLRGREREHPIRAVLFLCSFFPSVSRWHHESPLQNIHTHTRMHTHTDEQNPFWRHRLLSKGTFLIKYLYNFAWNKWMCAEMVHLSPYAAELLVLPRCSYPTLPHSQRNSIWEPPAETKCFLCHCRLLDKKFRWHKHQSFLILTFCSAILILSHYIKTTILNYISFL